MTFILWIVSMVLKAVIGFIGYICGAIGSLLKGEWSKYHMNLAISIDQYGNVICQYLFNALLIKKTGHKFGNPDETISSVVGKNKRDKTLKFLGRVLDKILDFFQKDHSIKSIDETEN